MAFPRTKRHCGTKFPETPCTALFYYILLGTNISNPQTVDVTSSDLAPSKLPNPYRQDHFMDHTVSLSSPLVLWL